MRTREKTCQSCDEPYLGRQGDGNLCRDCRRDDDEPRRDARQFGPPYAGAGPTQRRIGR